MHKALATFLFAAATTLVAMASSVPSSAPAELDQARKLLVQETCFEVVAPRPEQDRLSYERELPWDAVPFHIRQDKFASIGTAFAISPTELVTALHVIPLDRESASYPSFFIRDSTRKVYEVDQILAMDQHRDVVRFTVKGRTFTSWLSLQPRFELQKTVFTAGNAYGEGIVLRRGELLSTYPEEESGAFQLLKSSADVNSGNSGGPLLDAQGSVIGIVLRKKDNLCYSLPVSELQAVKPNTASFHLMQSFGFSLFTKRTKNLVYEASYPLPKPYRELKTLAASGRTLFYREQMEQLFKPEHEEIFPSGASSLEAIYDIPGSRNLEVLFKNRDTGKWDTSGLEYKSSDLGKNGWLYHCEAADMYFLRMIRPQGLALAELVDSPKRWMDLVLKGMNLPRPFADQQIRITSLGDPRSRKSLVDRFGRPWHQFVWSIDATDQVAIAHMTLTPWGPVGFLKFCPSSDEKEWTFDLERTLDFAYVPYIGRLSDWTEFLAMPAELPRAFHGMTLGYKHERALDFESPWLRLALPHGPIEITHGATLGLYMGFQGKPGQITWTLRRAVLQAEEENNLVSLLWHSRPDPSLEENYHKRWRDYERGRHPYTRKAFQDEGSTDIATVLEAFLPPGATTGTAPGLTTLYFSRVGTESEGRMGAWLATLLKGTRPASR